MEGQMVADVLAGDHAGKTVLALQETLMGEQVEVFADGDFRDTKGFRELGDGHAFVLADEVEKFHMTGLHGYLPFVKTKAPSADGKRSFWSLVPAMEPWNIVLKA